MYESSHAPFRGGVNGTSRRSCTYNVNVIMPTNAALPHRQVVDANTRLSPASPSDPYIDDLVRFFGYAGIDDQIPAKAGPSNAGMVRPDPDLLADL